MTYMPDERGHLRMQEPIGRRREGNKSLPWKFGRIYSIVEDSE